VVAQYVHPGFDLGAAPHDIAVLRLAEPVSSPYMVVARPQDTDVAPPGTVGAVYGWGTLQVTDDDGSPRFPPSSVLRMAPIPVVADSTCAGFGGDPTQFIHAPSELCAGAGSGYGASDEAPAADACFGDSGGPLVVSTGDFNAEIGLVGRGPTCGRSPTVYTDVRPFADFIDFTRSVRSSRFVDIADTIHEVSIERAAAAGVITGNNGRFAPADPVTRGAAAKMLAGALGLRERPGPSGYQDVDVTTFEGWINAATDAGVMSGFSDGTFRPGVEISRGQVASIIRRALGLPERSGSQFSDVDGSGTHDGSIYALVDAAITTGFFDGTYRPGLDVTRGQLSTFLVRGMPRLLFPPSD
jgi:hypothetical protein